MRDWLLALFLVSCSCLYAQGNLERLETDKGFETVKIGMMVFIEDYEAPPAAVVMSRHNEFSLLKDKANVGGFHLDGVSVWAQDLIIDRITMFVRKNDKDAFLAYLVDRYGAPEIIRDMYVWKSPTITLSYRLNPQKAAIKKKGQGLCVIWKTSEFEKILNDTNVSAMQMHTFCNAKFLQISEWCERYPNLPQKMPQIRHHNGQL